MRLGQLARELKIKPSEIVKFLKEEAKVEIENGPNTRLEDDYVSLVTDKFASVEVEDAKEVAQVKEEKSVEKKVEIPTPKKPVAKESRVSDEDEVFPDPKTIAVDPNAELIKARKPNFQEFKVVDKIDLPETNAKTVIEVDGVMLSPEEVEQREAKEKEEREAAIQAERERKAEIKAEKDKERALAEEKRLEKTFLDIKKFEQSNKRLKKEYIFVNDGSSDQTLSILKKKFKNNKRVKVVSYTKNMGKGYALKRGVQVANNEWVLTNDADCSVSNFQLIKWIKKKYLNYSSLIYFGSRNHRLSIVKKKALRKIVGMIFKFVIRIFFKIKIISLSVFTSN